MRTTLALILGLSASLLAGCDPIFGVSRHARVPFMPPVSGIEAVVKSTPGVDEVQYHFDEGDRPLTLTGLKPPDRVHSFLYRGGTNVHGDLLFVEHYDHRVEYQQSLLRMGSRPPQAWIDSTLPVMRAIESGLEANCGLTNLSASVKQWCRGVDCK